MKSNGTRLPEDQIPFPQKSVHPNSFATSNDFHVDLLKRISLPRCKHEIELHWIETNKDKLFGQEVIQEAYMSLQNFELNSERVILTESCTNM